MSKRQLTNVSASVRQLLLNLSREKGRDFQLLLTAFAIERFLFRLGRSDSSNRFVLKGATLFRLWSEVDQRLTRDLDLLGSGPDSVEKVVRAIREIASHESDDGLVFEPGNWTGREIRAAGQFAGVRIRGTASLEAARIAVQIDVGFGDAVYPRPGKETFPTLLDMPAPEILAYPREAVVAEKVEAMVTLGLANSRMKDFFDVHHLSRAFEFEGSELSRAVRKTFERRTLAVPRSLPVALTEEFVELPGREEQWRAFARRSGVETAESLADLIPALRAFIQPVLQAASADEPLAAHWPPGGPWQKHQET